MVRIASEIPYVVSGGAFSSSSIHSLNHFLFPLPSLFSISLWPISPLLVFKGGRMNAWSFPNRSPSRNWIQCTWNVKNNPFYGNPVAILGDPLISEMRRNPQNSGNVEDCCPPASQHWYEAVELCGGNSRRWRSTILNGDSNSPAVATRMIGLLFSALFVSRRRFSGRLCWLHTTY